ncbi:MAG: hypothetical protein PVG86_10140, partial [Desulfobacterales bacterium]
SVLVVGKRPCPQREGNGGVLRHIDSKLGNGCRHSTHTSGSEGYLDRMYTGIYRNRGIDRAEQRNAPDPKSPAAFRPGDSGRYEWAQTLTGCCPNQNFNPIYFG